ncbi:hypothetical protein KSF73_06715 [Burkholderiaceae bacterium DAT-1]|nr:hypothetical protein [Burkholderiaceae bacterium DAT-1]
MTPRTYLMYCVVVVGLATLINLFSGPGSSSSSGYSRGWGSGHSSGWSSGGHK